jgi:ribonuclease BN (tRNA processing enzyme)
MSTTTELVLLGTAGAPMPVAGRAGISAAHVVDGRVFVIDCGRGSPSAFVDAGLDFTRLEAVFLTHLHADHIGDLPGLLLYPWGVRAGENGPLAPIRVYGPSRPHPVPTGDAAFHRETTIHPELPAPGTTDLIESILIESILAGYAYHLNVMPLDARMPDPGALVRGIDIALPARTEGTRPAPLPVFDDGAVRVTAVAVTHGHAVPALAYRFDTADGSVVFSGDTTVNEDLIALAQGAGILVHHVADLGYLERHGITGAALERMAGLHTDVTEVGSVAERAGVGELILSHYLPAELDAITDTEWAQRAGDGFSGTTTLGRETGKRVADGAARGDVGSQPHDRRGRREADHPGQSTVARVERDRPGLGAPGDQVHVVVGAGGAEALQLDVVLVAPPVRGLGRRWLLPDNGGGHPVRLPAGVRPVLTAPPAPARHVADRVDILGRPALGVADHAIF